MLEVRNFENHPSPLSGIRMRLKFSNQSLPISRTSFMVDPLNYSKKFLRWRRLIVPNLDMSQPQGYWTNSLSDKYPQYTDIDAAKRNLVKLEFFQKILKTTTETQKASYQIQNLIGVSFQSLSTFYNIYIVYIRALASARSPFVPSVYYMLALDLI